VIHAVGPRWSGGEHGEPELLYGAYEHSLQLAKENGLHSIGFPLISAGIFGYPVDQAWERGIRACRDFMREYPDYEMKIIFAVLDERILAIGEGILRL
jgi:O-acetyl-ADP-ribose deacetylase (regulator of RNase III)